MFCRRDSTFYTQSTNTNYGKRAIDIISEGLFQERTPSFLISKKKRTAVWFVSNCASGSNAKRRLQISDEMIENGLKLDRYGKCFDGQKLETSRSAFMKLISSYKFYLAFENSLHCRDYITEKFFVNGLLTGAVPIVYGAVRQDYETVAPPHSFIHVEDFRSIKELVDYLNYLDKNDSAYAEYLSWRSMNPKDLYPHGRYMGLCALCRTLHGVSFDDLRPFVAIPGRNGDEHKTQLPYPSMKPISSIYEWWHGRESNECLSSGWNKSFFCVKHCEEKSINWLRDGACHTHINNKLTSFRLKELFSM